MTDAERDEVLNEALKAIAAKQLYEPKDEEDIFYDLGVTDSYCAVKSLLSLYVSIRKAGKP